MSAPVYFKFESCCTGDVLYFQGPENGNDPFWTSIFPVLPQVLVYDVLGSFGDNLGLISKSCYLVTVESGNGPVTTSGLEPPPLHVVPKTTYPVVPEFNCPGGSIILISPVIEYRPVSGSHSDTIAVNEPGTTTHII